MLGNWLAIHDVNCAVEPEPSECTTGMMPSAGSTRPLLSAVIAGSFHFVMAPVKILARVSPDSRRSSIRRPPTLIWYGNAVPPATMGRYAYGRLVLSFSPVFGS